MNYSKTTLLTFILLTMGLMISLPGYAITRTATTNNGSWTNPAHWSPSGVPTAADEVVIPSNITNFTAVGITMNFSTLIIDGRLTVGGFQNGAGVMTSTMAGSSVTVNGQFWQAETINLEADMTFNNGAIWDIRSYNINGVNGTPTITLNAGALARMTNLSNVSNTSVTYSNVDFVNFGTFRKNGGFGEAHIFAGNFTNEATGVVEVDGPGQGGFPDNVIDFSGTLLNKAGGQISSIHATRSELNLTGAVTNNGSISRPVLLTGTFEGTGTFDFGGTSVGGTIGPDACLTYTNNLLLSGTLDVDISGPTACTDFGQQTSNNTITIQSGSILDVDFGSFTSPGAGAVYTILDGASLSGTFGTVNGLPAGMVVQYDFPNTGEVSIVDNNVSSDLEFVVGTETSGPNNTVTVPVTVNNFDDIAAFQGTITFDPSVLTFVSAAGPAGSANFAFPYLAFGEPGVGAVPSDAITFSWFESNGSVLTQADGTKVIELTFTVNSSATTGFTDIEIDGSTTPLGYTDDISATSLLAPDVTQGGVTIDADAPTVDVATIQSDNVNDITLATVGDVITLSFTSSEALPSNPVVSIDKGGAGAITVIDQGGATSWTAEKTVAAGDDGVVTFSITIQDQYGNSSTLTATTDGSSVTVDTEAPVITCPPAIAQNSDVGVCGAVASFADATATDNLSSVGNITITRSSGDASGSTFPVGTSTIEYTATDEAGNQNTCTFDIVITDTEAPTITTVGPTFDVFLDVNGDASITVADLTTSITDPCGVASSVLSQSTFDCSDVANNPITVTITATDVNGQVATATVDVTVNADPVISLQGEARSELGTLIPSVTFDISGDDGPLTQTGSAFNFLASPCGSTNDIGAERIDTDPNGINVSDAFAIVQHFLQINQLGSNFKLIAADVNASNSINVLDAFQVLRRTLSLKTAFTNRVTGLEDANWTFIPTSETFPSGPYNFSTRRSYVSPSPVTGQDFTGVKLGDVDNSWDNAPNRVAAPDKAISFIMDAREAKTGELITIPVRIANFKEVAGYQYTMEWDASVLSLRAIHNKGLEAMYNEEDAANGRLASAWVDMQGQGVSMVDGSLAFEMVFEVIGREGSETAIELTSSVTPDKAYDAVGELMGVELNAASVQVRSTPTSVVGPELSGYSLGQNVPNPFGASTKFNFSLGQPEEVKIQIFSMTGQVVRSFDAKYGAGSHEILWNGQGEAGMKLGAGIYLVRMTAGEYSASIRVKKNN